MRACVHVCIRVCVHACVCACVRVCMRACVHALCLRGRGLLPDAETSSEERTSKTVSMATVEIELKRERFEGGKK